MALVPGARLGSYEIVSLVGAGGMGEVYRARDTKLDRRVAIKILPDSFAHDPERLARFEREAKTLAALNHPNIAIIHGFEEAHGIQALVMELVEGGTLADRIAQGPIPLDEALPIARQIAEALEAAHEHGIIHRDLKPANINVRPDGTVKVLDFGLAKALDPAPSSDLSRSPTMSAPATLRGVILGTAAYMSPEQARGKTVDKRTDIWAFGCVLYEMLTGEPAFARASVADTLASILQSDPDWKALPAQLPHAIRLLVERCLAKDRRRVADISTAVFILNEAHSLSPPSGDAPRASRRVRPLAAAAAAAAIGGLGVAAYALQTLWRPSPAEPQRVSIVLPLDQPIAFPCSPCNSLAISSDGTHVAYVSRNATEPIERREQLRVRSLGSLAVRDLPGTFRPRQPFFSPDGRWIGFFTTTGQLKKVALAGGNPVTIADDLGCGSFCFGLWLDDDTIIVGQDGLRRVHADGSAAPPVRVLDRAQGERFHLPVSFIREVGAVLFNVGQDQGGALRPRLDVVMLSSGERRVVQERSIGWIAGSHLLFWRDETQLAAPFDRARLAISGPAVPIGDEVFRVGTIPQSGVSATGTLAYVPGTQDRYTIGRVARSGEFTPFGVPPGRIRRPRVAPDGQQVAFELFGPDTTIVVYDVARGTTTKVTQSGSETQAVWHPSGNAMALRAVRRRDGQAGMFWRELGGAERLLVREEPGSTIRPESWSPTGNELAYTRQDGPDHSDIWIVAAGDPSTARPIVATPAIEHSPKFSPDGRWLAYVSFASGRAEVYVRAYPQGDPQRISNTGAVDPVWRHDGRTVFFRSLAGSPELMAATVALEGSAVKAGMPSAMFSLRAQGPTGFEQYAAGNNAGPGYDILPDGSFVMVRIPDAEAAREIVLVLNWFEELKRLVPTK
jgi:serine/threonine protein kinase